VSPAERLAEIGRTLTACLIRMRVHQRLIDQRTWEQVQSILQKKPRLRASNKRAKTPAQLKGLLFGPEGAAFSPTHRRKGDGLHRYDVSQTVLKHGTG
jgi:site-specific DNA recombinase